MTLKKMESYKDFRAAIFLMLDDIVMQHSQDSAFYLEKFDCLVIMNYRNHALGSNEIVENAQAMLREASTLKKKIVVAVETVKSTEGPRDSFYSMSNDAIEKELPSAHNQLTRCASYAGFAIHDFKSWQDMK